MPQADGTLRVSYIGAEDNSRLMFVPDKTHIAGTRPDQYVVFLPDAIGSTSYARPITNGEVQLRYSDDVSAAKAIRDVAIRAAERNAKVTVHVTPPTDGQLVVQAISIPARPARAPA